MSTRSVVGMPADGTLPSSRRRRLVRVVARPLVTEHGLSFLPGAMVWAIATGAWVAGGWEMPASWVPWAWVLAAVLAGLALATWPGAPPHLSGGARTLVDGLIVVASVLLVAWVAGLGSGYSAAPGEAMLLVAAGAQVTVGAAAIVILTRARAAQRRSLTAVAGALTAMAGAACAIAWVSMAPQSVAGLVVFCVASAAWLSFALGPAGRRAGAAASREPGLPTRASVFIPSTPFIAAIAASTVAGVRGDFHGFVLVSAAAIMVLIVLRQILALVENITFWRRLEAKVRARTNELRASEARFRSLVQHSSDVITVIDAGGVITYQSPSTLSVFGYEPDELKGNLRRDLVHPDDMTHAEAAAGELLRRPGSTIELQLRLRSRSAGWRHVQAIATNLLDERAVAGLVVNIRDITERKQLEEALTFRAFHDPLTNLPNRALFADRLGHALSRMADSPAPVAVLFLDLDEFKNVNDTLGHDHGDELLAAVGSRLLRWARDTDTVARLGGDEFAILIEDPGDAGAVGAVANGLLEELSKPLELPDGAMTARASIGIAMCPEAGTSAEDLLRAADVAMYAAKASGRGRCEFFEPSMRTALVERVQLEDDLRHAVERGELFLDYQPLVSLEEGSIRGTEALVRWRHPEQGVLPPVRFIGLAEERGLMGEIGSWVLRTACAQASEWQRRYGDGAPGRMIVNLSITQLEDPGLVEKVEEALMSSGLDPARLVLELTESVILENETAIARLRRLRETGVRISIDDFGTGYSALSYLRRLPIDALKIDRSFIDGLDGDSHKAAIVEAILVMCERLGIEPVAEGVEREEEAEVLRGLQCELAQGFLFARPTSPGAVAAMLDAAPAPSANEARRVRRGARRRAAA